MKRRQRETSDHAVRSCLHLLQQFIFEQPHSLPFPLKQKQTHKF